MNKVKVHLVKSWIEEPGFEKDVWGRGFIVTRKWMRGGESVPGGCCKNQIPIFYRWKINSLKGCIHWRERERVRGRESGRGRKRVGRIENGRKRGRKPRTNTQVYTHIHLIDRRTDRGCLRLSQGQAHNLLWVYIQYCSEIPRFWADGSYGQAKRVWNVLGTIEHEFWRTSIHCSWSFAFLHTQAMSFGHQRKLVMLCSCYIVK